MRKLVAPVVALVLLGFAGEAKAQFAPLDQVVIGVFPNGAVFVIRVNQSGFGMFTGAGMVLLPFNGQQDLRVDVGADIPGGGIILVGHTQTPNQPMAVLVDASNNLTFLYFGVAYTGTGMIINQ
jgi:hypothetical protein